MNKNKSTTIDEENELVDNEIRLDELWQTIWANRLVLVFFVFISLPISIMYVNSIPPEFKAEAVLEKPKDDMRSQQQSMSAGSMFSLLTGSKSGQDLSHVALIMSDSFLKTVAVNNPDLDNVSLNKFCSPYKPPQGFSLASLLVLLGISDVKYPSEIQTLDKLLKCVRKMIEIAYFKYGNEDTDAVKIIVRSQNAFFSANLANQIVQKYFLALEKNRNEKFRDVQNYLSQTISDAQEELSYAQVALQDFLIQHALLGNISTSSGNLSKGNATFEVSPFRVEMRKKISTLGQIEKSQAEFVSMKSKIINLIDNNYRDIDQIILTDSQAVLSRNFISTISKIFEPKNKGSFDLEKIVSQEIKRLEKQIQIFEKKIMQAESSTLKLMDIENRFQELAINVQKKLVTFEGLKDQLNLMIVEGGMESISKPVLLTEAVPPLLPFSPNKRQTVILGFLVSSFLGILYALMKQHWLKKIYAVSQVKKINKYLRCYQIKLSALKKRNDQALNRTFFTNLKNAGKVGCVIDLSRGRRSDLSLSSSFSMLVGKCLAVDNEKIICLDSEFSKSSVLFSGKKALSEIRDDQSGVPENNKTIFKEIDNSMIETGDLAAIKEKYLTFDRILCSLNSEVSDFIKFNLIEKCDFYIFVGKVAKIDEYVFKNFSDINSLEEKKCLGFFLIN